MTTAFRKVLSAAVFGLALSGLPGHEPVTTAAAAADYGPTSDQFSPFFTRIDKDGSTAWRRAVTAALRGRGFADSQIAKVSRLKLMPASGGMAGAYTQGKAGIAKFGRSELPMQFNPETGMALPLDPRAYAAALPACLATDERTCTLTYSTQEEDLSRTSAGLDDKTSCMLPRRTVLFCKSRGFVNRNTFHSHSKRRDFAPSCGEQDRINGCGADEAVFDDDTEQTKLVFDVTEAETPKGDASSKGGTSAAGDAPAPSPKTAPASPRIVYHADRDTAFTRRDGPATPEEWEPDLDLFKRLRAAERKQSKSLPTLQAEFDKRKTKWIGYCWPHDVYKPCDVE